MALDPVTAGLEALAAGINAFSAGKTNKIAKDNLAFQRQNAMDELKFAKAGRTDAYGNTTNFDDALNQWITQLTPEQQKLVKGQEHEQLLSTTQDAAQNRDVRQRAFQRGIQGGEDFNTAEAGYRYDQPHSRDAIQNEITNLITQSRGTGDRAESALAGRELMRTHGNLPLTLGGTYVPGGAGAKLANTMLQARQQALGESQSVDQAHQNKYLPALSQFNAQAMGGGNAGVNFSSTPGDVSNREDFMSQLVQNALKSGGAGVQAGSALNTKTSAAMTPDFGDIAKLITAAKAGDKTAKAGDPGYYGGSPGGNSLLNPSTYGNRNWLSSDYGDFTL